MTITEKSQNLRRLQAQRNELNAKGKFENLIQKLGTLKFICYYFTVRMLREELQLLQEQGSYVGEIVKAMDKKKVLVKVFVKHLIKNMHICLFKKNY